MTGADSHEDNIHSTVPADVTSIDFSGGDGQYAHHEDSAPGSLVSRIPGMLLRKVGPTTRLAQHYLLHS